VRLNGIKPGSLLGTLGLKNGDKLTKVNGMDVSDPKAALELYARLSSADHLVVSVDRRGEPMNIDVAIK
jgi:general secretion pathway protein C